MGALILRPDLKLSWWVGTIHVSIPTPKERLCEESVASWVVFGVLFSGEGFSQGWKQLQERMDFTLCVGHSSTVFLSNRKGGCNKASPYLCEIIWGMDIGVSLQMACQQSPGVWHGACTAPRVLCQSRSPAVCQTSSVGGLQIWQNPKRVWEQHWGCLSIVNKRYRHDSDRRELRESFTRVRYKMSDLTYGMETSLPFALVPSKFPQN